MPTNKELIEDIKAIDPNVKTDGLTNKQLVEALKTLRDDSVEPPATTSASGERKVAAGRAITTRSGIKAGGDVVTVRDLSGGRAALDALIAAGFVE